MALCNCRVESPTPYLFSNNYKCNGNERSLCECENTEGFGSPTNAASSTINIQCEEKVILSITTYYLGNTQWDIMYVHIICTSRNMQSTPMINSLS